MDALIRADLEGSRQVVRFLLRWTSWARGLELAGMYYESVNILLRELDLRDEARHTERFKRMFAGGDRFVIPTVYPEFS
jgi:predicted unusual protein kinase regulating ubiquinone biosynthesis (AarF/ABC1/UbiB family)